MPPDAPIIPYEISPRVRLQAAGAPPPAGDDGPATRPLRVFTLDPSVSHRLGGVATVQVPYERLAPGPVGALFAVDTRGAPKSLETRALDLDDPAVLLAGGLAPSPANGRFHLQMVYAVCSATHAVFRRALGRDVVWSCGTPDAATGRPRLRVRPFGIPRTKNAFFSRDLGALTFGYFAAGAQPAGFTAPKGLVFTALSHDVVAHETTHALLDALRSEFATPTSADVLGFHEGFADVVALLLHFSYPDVVAQGLRDARGSLSRASLLTGLAQEFGYATSPSDRPAPLRTAVDVAGLDTGGPDGFDADRLPGAPDAKLRCYRPDLEEHEMGLVLATAVFEAFVTVFRRRSERYLRLAGVAPDRIGQADLSDVLIKILAEEAAGVAARVLEMCIRAVDYCPPVDLELGEYLRALVTADGDLVPDDRWCYREAMMRAFRRRGIFPDNVRFMSEDALRWEPPPRSLEVPGLAFRELRFNGDPGQPADADEMERQAHALGAFVSDPAVAPLLRLVSPRAPRPASVEGAAPPRVASIRCARRVAPNGSVRFDLVAEVTQTVTVRDGAPGAGAGAPPFEFFGGCTLVIDPLGRVRYAISKRLDSVNRRARQQAAVLGPLRRYWEARDSRLRPVPELFRALHAVPGDGTGRRPPRRRPA